MLRNRRNRTDRKQLGPGFSMVEMTVAVSIVLLLIGIALVNIVPSLRSSKSNAGMELVLGELRRAMNEPLMNGESIVSRLYRRKRFKSTSDRWPISHQRSPEARRRSCRRNRR